MAAEMSSVACGGDKPLVLCRADCSEDPECGFHDTFLALLREHFRVVFYRDLDARPELGQNIVGAVILKYVDGLYDRLPLLPKLKVVANHGAGMDHINFDLFRERGIKMSNTPGVLNEATADLGMALMLASARNLVPGLDEVKSGPELFNMNYFGVDVSNATLGIIGMGSIGLDVAKRARGFNMKILYHNRSKNSRDAEVNAEFCPDLRAMLPRSDFVMVTCALTSETEGLVGEAELASMKPTATLINISRGKVVNHVALLDALQNNRIRGAAMDVTDPEPLPRDHPLQRLDNVIVTPHIGSATIQTRVKMYKLCIANLLAGINGKPLPNEVNGNN